VKIGDKYKGRFVASTHIEIIELFKSAIVSRIIAGNAGVGRVITDEKSNFLDLWEPL
jgi:hypothetical protein